MPTVMGLYSQFFLAPIQANKNSQKGNTFSNLVDHGIDNYNKVYNIKYSQICVFATFNPITYTICIHFSLYQCFTVVLSFWL